MEAFSSLPPEPPRGMADAHMDLIMNTPQQSLLPQLIPLAPGRRFLPDSSNPEPSRSNLKRSYSEEEKKGQEEEDEELLFDIDEFLVEEDALIHGDHESHTCCDEKEGATIIAESPTNTNTNSNPMVEKENTHMDGPIPDVASTNATIINVHNCNNNEHSSKCNSSSCKKKRKKKSPSKPKQPNSSDSCVPPKRPLSAYNLYFREERKRRIADAASNHTKKYNFEELGRLIGKGWRSLPIKEKRELEARAEADRERYRNEMIAYRREKRRRAREEDQDTLLFMRQRHSAGGQLTPCPPSPHNPQHPPGSFSPKRNDQYPYQRYVTISPGQRDYSHEPHRYSTQDKQQHQLYPHHAADSPNKNHVRKVSLSISSPHYNNTGTDHHRSVNNTSPAVSSYESCSSLSGDECREDRLRKRKKNDERKRDSEDPCDGSNKSRKEHPPAPNDPRYNDPEAGATHRAEVPVARVVAMPATDGLQRMLQESRPTYAPPPPAEWAPWGHPPPHHFHHVSHPPPYTSPPASAPADIRRYSLPPLPPPPLSIVGSSQQQQQQQQQQHYSAPTMVPLPPQMLPMGMSILLRDPATGKERSYTIQYTPKLMTQEQANQFQRDHEAGEKGQAQK